MITIRCPKITASHMCGLTAEGRGPAWIYREQIAGLWREKDLSWRFRAKPRGPIEYEALLDGPEAPDEEPAVQLR